MSNLDQLIKEHATESYPEECVGFVKDGEYHRLPNVSNDPQRSYKLSAKDKVMVFTIGVDALVHSHPDMDNKLSKEDLKAQQSCCIPFWVVGTDGVLTTEINKGA